MNLPRVRRPPRRGLDRLPGVQPVRTAVLIRPILPALVAGKASPVGIVDALAGSCSVVLSGWTFDPLETDPIEVHVYVDGVGRNLGPTPYERPDLATAYPGVGTRHGFATTIGDLSPGSHSVCVFGINTGRGSNTLPSCRDVVVQTGDPVGNLDSVWAGPDGTVAVSGWGALDPDQGAGIEIHAYVDGRGTNLGPAANYRPDIAGVFPGYGGSHGFSWVTSGLGAGRHDVCVFAINVGAGSNNLLGCRTVVAPGGAPVGVLDAAAGGPDGALALWGLDADPDTVGPTEVHVYVDGVGINLGRANGERADIAVAFPGYGSPRVLVDDDGTGAGPPSGLRVRHRHRWWSQHVAPLHRRDRPRRIAGRVGRRVLPGPAAGSVWSAGR